MTVPERTTRRVLLGEIAGAHGLRGAVLVRTYTAEPESIAAYGPLEDESGRRRFTLAVERVSAKGVVARIDGVTTRTEAERLKGTKLYVAREALPETAEGEFYRVDLVGLTAVDGDGAVVGEVVSVENYGASDVLEIRLKDSRATELIPLTESFVLGVDLAAARIVVSMPAESTDDDDMNTD